MKSLCEMVNHVIHHSLHWDERGRNLMPTSNSCECIHVAMSKFSIDDVINERHHEYKKKANVYSQPNPALFLPFSNIAWSIYLCGINHKLFFVVSQNIVHHQKTAEEKHRELV